MPRKLARTTAIACVAFLLVQLACNQLASQPATEAPAAATSTPGIETVVFEPPAAGQRMLWTDASTVVYVPGGSFVMGQDEKAPSDHSPAHTVSVGPFWIYQAEVTNRMYRTCVKLGVCTEPTQSLWYGHPEYENAPVSGVDWNQAKAYCGWMNGRLPTEAEWELAARGTEADPYPWGEDEPTCELGNFLNCLVPSVPDAVRSYPLGASEYNVADMAGNVSEWVADWHAEEYYAASPAANPLGPTSGEERVVRGSSYLSPVEDTKIYLRSSQNPLQSQPNIGFRCVVNSDAPEIAPMCSVLSYDLSWDPLGTPQSPVEQGTAIVFDPGCGINGHWYADVETTFYIKDYLEGIIGTIAVTSSQGEVECQAESLGMSHFAFCFGPASHPGQSVTLTFCMEPNLPESVAPTCPASYEYNPVTVHCEYNPGPGGGQCNGGMVVEGYGCLYPPVNGQCPAGYYSASYNGSPVCVPAAGPPSPDPDHPLAACPEGLGFDDSKLCCEYPPDVSPVCPVGFTFDAQSALCSPEPMAWCTSISAVVPDCEPTLPPPPPPSCTSFGDKLSCEAAGCTWTPPGAIPSRCVPK